MDRTLHSYENLDANFGNVPPPAQKQLSKDQQNMLSKQKFLMGVGSHQQFGYPQQDQEHI